MNRLDITLKGRGEEIPGLPDHEKNSGHCCEAQTQTGGRKRDRCPNFPQRPFAGKTRGWSPPWRETEEFRGVPACEQKQLRSERMARLFTSCTSAMFPSISASRILACDCTSFLPFFLKEVESLANFSWGMLRPSRPARMPPLTSKFASTTPHMGPESNPPVKGTAHGVI
jgi:hypothetical protein